jgi:putative hydrolase of HD superfamily
MKKDQTKKKIENLTNFIFEFRFLKRVPRAGLVFLKGPVKENISEHSFYTAILSWILAKLENANEEKTIKMALIHDLCDVRGVERNLVNKFYSFPCNELKIIEEITKDYNIEDFHLKELLEEFLEKKTKEAKILRDADILSQMLLEKDCLELGNSMAKKWLQTSLKRLKTKYAKKIGKEIIKKDSDEWWLNLVKKYLHFTEFL